MPQVQKIALFDLGSNSIRCLLGMRVDGVWHNEPKRLWTTRLGGRTPEGYLTEEAMAATMAALEEGVAAAKAYGATYMAAAGTSAMREAPNGRAFADTIAERFGMPVYIWSGEEEAQYGFRGATADFLIPGKRCMVVDIGGGSTEISLGSVSQIDTQASYPIGIVRLKPISDEGIQRIWEETHAVWDGVDMGDDFVGCIGIGGTFTTLAAMDLKLDPYDPSRVHGHVLTREKVESEALYLRYTKKEVYAKRPGLMPGRVDVILCGAEIVSSVMDMYDLGSVVISEKDSLEGWQESLCDT